MRSRFIAALEQVAGDNDDPRARPHRRRQGLLRRRRHRRHGAAHGCAGRRGRLQRLARGSSACTTRIALLHTLPKPVIAAVNGAASAWAPTWRWPATSSSPAKRPASPGRYIKRGLIPDGGGMYFLPRRVGLSRAKELIFTGRKVEADEALALGIADRMTPADALLGRCAGLGRRTVAGLGHRARARQVDPQPELRAAGRSRCSRRAARRRASATRAREHRDSVLAFLDAGKATTA